MTQQDDIIQAAQQHPIDEAIVILTEEAAALRECHTPSGDRDDWTGESEAKGAHDNMLRVADALSKLRAPKPLGDRCHHCGWMDWLSQDGAAYCQACGKPHGSVPKEGLPNLPELLRENADLDAAEGGNPDVVALEWAAADEIERLRREVAKLRAPVAGEARRPYCYALESRDREGVLVDIEYNRVDSFSGGRTGGKALYDHAAPQASAEYERGHADGWAAGWDQAIKQPHADKDGGQQRAGDGKEPQ
ncbi:hypothetical protein [Achromobacter xylosoxidans]|uniref:hypothetical protein n=1 Tax=Alcaligenes xylosoxydans xylosoxydans TaxID=85698 RepID=UPI001F1059BB|nr:hypothetical protein [Achromobacter xylosoxidans]MCH4572210.1 hypothetical protein [Achromobacter xylosoxidans]